MPFTNSNMKNLITLLGSNNQENQVYNGSANDPSYKAQTPQNPQLVYFPRGFSCNVD